MPLRKALPFVLALVALALGIATFQRFVWLPHQCNVAKGKASRQLKAAMANPDPYYRRLTGLRNVEALDGFLRKLPRDAELAVIVADSLAAAGRHQAARELYCGTLEYRRTAVLYVACGNAQLLNGEKERALQNFVLAGEFAGPRILATVHDAALRAEAMRRVGARFERNLAARGELEQRNLVANGGFDIGGPSGPRTDQRNRNAAAASWALAALGSPASSELLPAGGRDGSAAFRVEVAADGAGLSQVLVPRFQKPRVRTTVWLFVERGTVCMGTSDAKALLTNVCSKSNGAWEKLEAINESCPAVAVSIVAKGPEGAAFIVDEVTSKQTYAAPPCER